MKKLLTLSLSLSSILFIALPARADLQSDYNREKANQKKIDQNVKTREANSLKFCEVIKKNAQYNGVGMDFGGQLILVKSKTVYSFDPTKKNWKCDGVRGYIDKEYQAGIFLSDRMLFKIVGNELVLFEKLSIGGTRRIVVGKKR